MVRIRVTYNKPKELDWILYALKSYVRAWKTSGIDAQGRRRAYIDLDIK